MDQLREKGWNLTEEGLKKISNNGAITHAPTLIKTALNTDLREIGASVFPTESKSKFEVPKQGMVLQIIKIIKNVAAPKVNQDSKFAPRLLKVQFTDGQNQFSGIEVEHISTLSLFDTKPGTKLFFRPGNVIQISQDLLLLRANYFDVLGGHVTELVDKWEVAQRYSKFSTGIRAITQAPPWIAFGQKIDRKSVNVNKKSLSGSGADKKDGEESKEDDPFENQRKEAIAEASAEAQKRVFLDGGKKIVHHNVQKIVDKGFTEDQAKEALKYSRNDLGRALASLKRPGGGDGEDDGRFRNSSSAGGGRGGRGGRGGGARRGRGRFGDSNDESEEFMAKPSEKISLFDFIGDKLPPEVKNAALPTPSTTTTTAASTNRPTSYPENNRHSNKFSGESRFGRDGGRGRGNARDHHNNNNRHSDFPRHQTPSFSHSRGGPAAGNHHPSNPRNDRNFPPHPPPSHGQRHSNPSHSDRGGANLARDMERMSLSNRPQHNHNAHPQQQKIANHHQPPQFPQQNHHQQQQRQNSSNGFPNYDPRKTPGFLNKESNEAAKKFMQGDHPPPSQPGPHFQQNHRAQQRPPPQSQHANESTSTWNWKIGDRCLAKYWEDGKYYNAEITGIAGRTCVVHFMEYSNFEEVLKDDCLPITA